MRQAEGEVCCYCEGSGWQTLAYVAESSNENTAVRPCACSILPIEKRSAFPLREPQWQKRQHSAIWERVT
jgi:hypothetical protein